MWTAGSRKHPVWNRGHFRGSDSLGSDQEKVLLGISHQGRIAPLPSCEWIEDRWCLEFNDMQSPPFPSLDRANDGF